MRLHCTRYICGSPLLTNNMRIGLTKDGWPKRLLFLKPFADSISGGEKKFILTILNFSRSWVLTDSEWKKVKPDLKSITTPCKGDLVIDDKFLSEFVKDFDLKLDIPDLTLKDLYMSDKAGPQGPASKTSMMNLPLYNKEELSWLKDLTGKFGASFLDLSISENRLLGEKPKLNCKGKLSVIHDPEAKLRLIAISDYYTQLYLKPIHSCILQLLNKFKTDRTFTQNPFHNWQDNSEGFYSLDLSSATDRFPISLQERLLSFIWNDKLSKSWMKILQEREFCLDAYEAEHNLTGFDTVKYACGQPMGTYSSWAVFTLTHHFIVYYCARLEGFKSFNQYIILGDDIVIKNEAIAKRYIEVMNGLGVEISVQKTHVSKDTYEFAKRWIQPYGVIKEITGIPLKGIISNFNDHRIVYSILYDYFKIKENLWLSNFSLVELIGQLYKSTYIFSKPKKSKSKKDGKKLPPKKIWLSLNRKMYKQIMSLKLALDITFNYITYENFKKAWISNVNYEELHCPPNLKIGLFELKRILIGGLASSVFKGDLPIFKRPRELIVDNFEDTYDSKSLVPHPQFLGLFNNLVNKLTVLDRFKDHGGIGLYNAAKSLSAINYKTIYNKDKEKLIPVLEMGKLITKSFNILPIMMDFVSFDTKHPERMLFYCFHHNMEKAIRKIAFYWLKWYPEHKRLEPFSRFRDQTRTKYVQTYLRNGLIETRRLELLIDKWVKRNWDIKGLVDVQWIERKSKPR